MSEEKDTTKSEDKEKKVEENTKASAVTEAKKTETETPKQETEKTTDTETEKAASDVPAPTKKPKKRKFRRQVQRGCAFIRSSYNNTVVSFTDLHGNILAWSSSGLLGFKGAKKATTYAATQVAADVHEKAQKYGLKDVDVYIKGVGSGREAALRALAQKGYNLTRIKDITPIPHNGCRPRKPRRV